MYQNDARCHYSGPVPSFTEPLSHEQLVRSPRLPTTRGRWKVVGLNEETYTEHVAHSGCPSVPEHARCGQLSPPSGAPAHHRGPLSVGRSSSSLNSIRMTLHSLGIVGCPRASRGPGAQARDQHCPWGTVVTFVAVKGVGSQAQGGGTDAAAETLSVEEVALCAQPLHHVHALLTEVTGVAATQVQGKCLSHRFLGGHRAVGEKSSGLGLRQSLQMRGQAFRSSGLNHGDVVGSCFLLTSLQVLQQTVSVGRYVPSTGPTTAVAAVNFMPGQASRRAALGAAGCPLAWLLRFWWE